MKPHRVRLDFYVNDTDRRAIANLGWTRGYDGEIQVNGNGLATDRGVRTWMEEQLRIVLEDIVSTDICVTDLGCQGAGDHDDHHFGDGPVTDPNDPRGWFGEPPD